MSLYAFHLGQIISTVLGQVDHDGQHGNTIDILYTLDSASNYSAIQKLKP